MPAVYLKAPLNSACTVVDNACSSLWVKNPLPNNLHMCDEFQSSWPTLKSCLEMY